MPFAWNEDQIVDRLYEMCTKAAKEVRADPINILYAVVERCTALELLPGDDASVDAARALLSDTIPIPDVSMLDADSPWWPVCRRVRDRLRGWRIPR